MSNVILVQVGQCGNQLCESLLDVLHDGCVSKYKNMEEENASIRKFINRRSIREMFFHSNKSLDEEEQLEMMMMKGSNGKDNGASSSSSSSKKLLAKQKRVARAILVDMEPRVVNQCLSRKGKWKYDGNACLTFEGGSGNNWAQGYSYHGPKNTEQFIEIARRQVESCDYLGGFMIFQSVAGGTGSGLGSYLTESLEDAFPNASRMNGIVFPHSSGEVVVQNYNTLLTLAHLQSSSNGLICLFNDYARYVSHHFEKISTPDMQHLNQLFARDISTSLLLPSVDTRKDCGWLNQDLLNRTICGLCSDAGMKYIQVQSYPQMAKDSIAFSNNSWSALLKQITETSPCKYTVKGSSFKLHENEAPLAQIITLRGREAKEFSLEKRFTESKNIIVSYEQVSQTLFGFDRMISCATNSPVVSQPLSVYLEKAKLMFQENAYVHQYENNGITKETMEESFIKVEQTIHTYKQLII